MPRYPGWCEESRRGDRSREPLTHGCKDIRMASSGRITPRSGTWHAMDLLRAIHARRRPARARGNGRRCFEA
ncbi:MAG: hypothetical protein CMJ52_03805 [Planctomycetaceae bacterium]|nr:hypothetical protein [Planctomycetaceae bacterium]